MLDRFRLFIGRALARYLNKPIRTYAPFSVHRTSTLENVLQPGDILLVEGNTRISTAIKYLTQSTWSHAAIYVGAAKGHSDKDTNSGELVEADLTAGVIRVPLSKYAQFNTRICRPVGLSDEDRKQVVNFVVESIGKSYDLKNITDLARYLIPNPPVPTKVRRRMLALGSGDPTRAICSTLIAQAYQKVKYPVLPIRTKREDNELTSYSERDIFHIRHYSLFAPRDFDLSPYFQVIKPTIERKFDYKQLVWAEED
ncbi:YiiX/YebB-like N1pC/P60 family cysteine hydrolase [Pseudomonadota bacterium]